MNSGRGLPHVVRVLCVDDNHDIADSLSELLSSYGYEVVARYDGPSALAAVDGGFRPDACFIDLNMPGMAGDDLAAALLARLPAAPPLLIAVTAQDDPAARSRTRAVGFRAHFVKPADPARLLAVLAPLDG